MSNSDHRQVIGLKALERSASPRTPQPAALPTIRGTAWPLPYTSVARPPTPAGRQAGGNGSLLSLAVLAEQPGEPLSERKLLGVCEDELNSNGGQANKGKAPYLVDRISPLNNRPGLAPAPGSLLVVGDPGSGKTRLLRGILICAAQHNTPGQAGFYLAAHQPAQFSDIGHLEHCRLVMQTYDRSLGAAVQELADLAEERRAQRLSGPAVILAIDDLASALLGLDEQAVTLLYWLIRHGPRLRVWTIATLSTRRSADLDLHFLEAFRSRLVGHIADPVQAQSLSLSQDLAAWKLEKGRRFYLPYDGSWLRFRLCDPQLSREAQPLTRLWRATE